MEDFDKKNDEDEVDIAELEFPSEEDEGEIDNIIDSMNNGNSNPPFGSAPSWGSFGSSSPSTNPNPNPFTNNNGGTGVFQSPPWQRVQQPQISPSPFFGTGWNNNNNNNQQVPQFAGPTQPATIKPPKDVVIINLFDGLIESRSSEGKPNIIPRAIYDIKFKFDVWDSIRLFTPHCIYILVSVVIPDSSIGWNITFKYITSCLSEYLNIPESSCILVKQMTQGLPKIILLKNILESGNFLVDKDSCIYIGLNSGYWGLSNEDILAANSLGIDYVDIFQLINGNFNCI